MFTVVGSRNKESYMMTEITLDDALNLAAGLTITGEADIEFIIDSQNKVVATKDDIWRLIRQAFPYEDETEKHQEEDD